ncbi:hypothetical protein SHIRM173S_02962 [Streptomyces hirsutus]
MKPAICTGCSDESRRGGARHPLGRGPSSDGLLLLSSDPDLAKARTDSGEGARTPGAPAVPAGDVLARVAPPPIWPPSSRASAAFDMDYSWEYQVPSLPKLRARVRSRHPLHENPQVKTEGSLLSRSNQAPCGAFAPHHIIRRPRWRVRRSAKAGQTSLRESGGPRPLALYKAAADGLPTLADKGYIGAGILLPVRHAKGQSEEAHAEDSNHEQPDQRNPCARRTRRRRAQATLAGSTARRPEPQQDRRHRPRSPCTQRNSGNDHR